MSRRTIAFLVGSLALAAIAQPRGLGAQTAQKSEKQTPVVRVTTRLVQVNLIARDRKGQPVRDLTAEDFVLLDKGREERIRSFAKESRFVEGAPPPPLPPNTFTNRPGAVGGAAPTSATVILFDVLNTSFADQAFALDQVVRFLRQLRPEDRVALCVLGNGLHLLHDFTNDATPLIRALERHGTRHTLVREAATKEDPNTGVSVLDEAVEHLQDRITDFHAQRRARITFSAIETIGNRLAGLPGRKNLVWVSGSFPFILNEDLLRPRRPIGAGAETEVLEHTPMVRTFSAEADRAARAINHANVAIYPVDARGLIGAFPPETYMQPRTSSRPGRPTFTTLAQTGPLTDVMTRLADHTGGRAFFNSNDIQGAIRRAVDDSEFTYVLGYYPTHGQWDSKFREIRMRVKRPGITLRYRKGYIALPDESVAAAKSRAAFQIAESSPMDATGLALTVHAERVAAPASPRETSTQGPDASAAPVEIKLKIVVDARGISLQPEASDFTGGLDFVFLQRDAEGKTLDTDGQRLDLRPSPDAYQKLLAEGLVANWTLRLVPGAHSLRIAVRDRRSGATGTVTIPMTSLQP